MALKRQRITPPREIQWTRNETWPHEYANQILEGKLILKDVPQHYQDMVATFLAIAKHADERMAAKLGVQIASINNLWTRRAALTKVPAHLRKRTEHYSRQFFETYRRRL